MKRKLTLLFISLSLMPVMATASHPNDGYRGQSRGIAHSWAREYAETAVRQSRKAQRLGCGFHGNRWSSNYRQHFEWALREKRRKGLVEIDRRNEALYACETRYGRAGNRGHNDSAYRGNNQRGNNQRGNHRRGHDQGGNWRGISGNRRALMRYSRDEFARWYADTAIAQVSENHQSGCGLRGGNGRWKGNWNNHYRFGLQARREDAIREVDYRNEQLRNCNRGHRYGF